MKVIIAGSRKGFTYSQVEKCIQTSPIYLSITEIVSGHAYGVDRYGEMYARENGLHLTIFCAEWNRYGKRAGMVRNRAMAEYADGLIALWDGVSKGTANMIKVAKEYGLVVYVKGMDR